MSLLFADSFDHYATADSPLKWDIGTANIAAVGRRATNGLSVNYSYGIARNIGAQTTIICGMAVFPFSSDLDTTNIKHNGSPVSSTLTSRCYLFGLGYQGVAQIGIAFTNDGALHVIRGGAFDLGSGAGGVDILASSAANAIRMTGWSYVEAKFIASASTGGTVIVKVNGVTKITQTGVQTTRPSGGLPASYTQFLIGGATFGELVGAGWAGKVDDLYVFNGAGDTNNDFIGDVRVDYLRPDGAGAAADSVIQGTSPAPTRWQSVDDTLPDAEVTCVTLEAVADEDSHTHEDLPYTSATVFGVQGVIAARKSDAGLAAIVHTQRVNAATDEGDLHYPAGGEFSFFLTPFDKAADNVAWDLTRINDSEFGVKRVAIP